MTDAEKLDIAVKALLFYAKSYRTVVVSVDHRLEFMEKRDAERIAIKALEDIGIL